MMSQQPAVDEVGGARLLDMRRAIINEGDLTSNFGFVEHLPRSIFGCALPIFACELVNF